jgi:hypothetical protein
MRYDLFLILMFSPQVAFVGAAAKFNTSSHISEKPSFMAPDSF